MFVERNTRDESSQGILERLNTRGWTKKKRSAAYPSYWLEGLKLSRRIDDEPVIHFRRKELLVLSGALTSNINKPNCSLCDEMEYEPDLVYLACEACGAWFHGEMIWISVTIKSKLRGSSFTGVLTRCHLFAQEASSNFFQSFTWKLMSSDEDFSAFAC